MVDEPEKKTQVELQKELANAVATSIKGFYKPHNNMKPATQKAFNAKIDYIFSPESAIPVDNTSLTTILENVYKGLSPVKDNAEVNTRNAALRKLDTISTGLLVSREKISRKIDIILTDIEVSKEIPEFALMKRDKRLDIMIGLQGSIDDIMSSKKYETETDRKKALKSAVLATLTKATDEKLPTEVDHAADSIVTDVMDADKTMRTNMDAVFKDLGLFKGQPGNESVAYAQKVDAIEADADQIRNEPISGIALGAASEIKPPLSGREKDEAIVELQNAIIEVLDDLDDREIALNDPDATQALTTKVAGTAIGKKNPGAISSTVESALKLAANTREQVANRIVSLDKTNEETRERILERATSGVWPEIVREVIPDADKLNYATSTMVGSIKQEGAQMAPEQKIKYNSVVKDLRTFVQDDTIAVSKRYKFIADNLKGAPSGGQLIPGVNMGMPTLAAAGGAAVVGLATEMSLWKKALVGVGLVGGALAYENWDAVSKATNLPGGTPAGAKKDSKTLIP